MSSEEMLYDNMGETSIDPSTGEPRDMVAELRAAETALAAIDRVLTHPSLPDETRLNRIADIMAAYTDPKGK